MQILLAALLLQSDPVDLLPPETVFYADLHNSSAVPGAFKAYVKRFAAKGEDDAVHEKLLTLLKTGLTEILSAAPGGLSLDSIALVFEVESAHVAVTRGPGRRDLPEGLAVLTLKDADAARRIIDDFVKPNANESAEFGERRAYRLGPEAWIVAADRRILASASLHQLGLALARADAKTPAAKIPLLARLSPVEPGIPTVRFFVDAPRIFSRETTRLGRSDAWQSEVTNLTLRLESLGPIVGRLRIADGALQTHIDVAGSSLFSSFLGTRAPHADLTSFVPPGAWAVAAAGVKDVWDYRRRLRADFNRNDEIVRQSGRADSDWWAEFEGVVAEALDVTVDDILGAWDGDVAAFIRGDFQIFGAGKMPQIGFIVRGNDPAQIAWLADQIVNGKGALSNVPEFAPEKYRDANLYVLDEPELAYALIGNWLLMGNGAAVVKAMIDAHKDGPKLADRLKALPGGEAMLAGAAEFIALDLRPLFEVAAAMGGAIPGGLSKDDLADAALDFLAGRPTADGGTRLESSGTGYTTAVVPFGFFSLSRAFGMSFRDPSMKDPENTEPRLPPADAAVDVDPTIPADAKGRDEWIEAKIGGLRSDDAGTREDATSALRRAGPLARVALGKAVRGTDDEEVKARIMFLLEAIGAYDEMPQLVAENVERLVKKLDACRIYLWREDVQGPSIRGVDDEEPDDDYRYGYYDLYPLEPRLWDKRFKEEAVLRSTAAIETLVKHLSDATKPKGIRRNLAALLAVHDSGASEKAILDLLDKEKDAWVSRYLRIALGWGSSEGARKVTLDGFTQTDVMLNRTSFLAAERRPSDDVVDALVERLSAPDAETRFNAAYTLRRVTAGAINVKAFLPGKERAPQVDAARAWWKENRGKVKLAEKPPGGDW